MRKEKTTKMFNSKTHVLVQPTIYGLFYFVKTLTITNIIYDTSAQVSCLFPLLGTSVFLLNM